MVSSVSTVISNIYVEYFEEMALCPECCKPSPWWTRYVDNAISIVKETKYLSY